MYYTIQDIPLYKYDTLEVKQGKERKSFWVFPEEGKMKVMDRETAEVYNLDAVLNEYKDSLSIRGLSKAQAEFRKREKVEHLLIKRVP